MWCLMERQLHLLRLLNSTTIFCVRLHACFEGCIACIHAFQLGCIHPHLHVCMSTLVHPHVYAVLTASEHKTTNTCSFTQMHAGACRCMQAHAGECMGTCGYQCPLIRSFVEDLRHEAYQRPGMLTQGLSSHASSFSSIIELHASIAVCGRALHA